MCIAPDAGGEALAGLGGGGFSAAGGITFEIVTDLRMFLARPSPCTERDISIGNHFDDLPCGNFPAETADGFWLARGADVRTDRRFVLRAARASDAVVGPAAAMRLIGLNGQNFRCMRRRRRNRNLRGDCGVGGHRRSDREHEHEFPHRLFYHACRPREGSKFAGQCASKQNGRDAPSHFLSMRPE